MFFDGYDALTEKGEPQHVHHLSMMVETQEDFDSAYQRLQDQDIKVSSLVERFWGKTYYFIDPNDIEIQISLYTTVDIRVCDDPNSVASVEKYLVRN